ncbi:hypothetical protein QE152_g10314 [Popillia japonica]|uniref:Uncharacterized protein n=1 Tax=Popillia japonica TaxID=7064 RepID=A0AAW1LRY2_POPJA
MKQTQILLITNTNFINNTTNKQKAMGSILKNEIGTPKAKHNPEVPITAPEFNVLSLRLNEQHFNDLNDNNKVSGTTKEKENKQCPSDIFKRNNP